MVRIPGRDGFHLYGFDELVADLSEKKKTLTCPSIGHRIISIHHSRPIDAELITASHCDRALEILQGWIYAPVAQRCLATEVTNIDRLRCLIDIGIFSIVEPHDD